jgi:hypothetical protein
MRVRIKSVIIAELFQLTGSQFSVVIATIISAVPYLAHGFAIPDANTAVEIRGNNAVTWNPALTFRSTELVSKRADDDEWVMVVYNGGSDTNQCGGTANNFSGTSSLCQGLTNVVGKICADVKVQANVGIASCTFSFRADGSNCGGTERQSVKVDAGKDSNGVKLSDDVRFINIDCS